MLYTNKQCFYNSKDYAWQNNDLLTVKISNIKL